MSKTVIVTVLREHTGDAGYHADKSEYPTTLQHALELKAQGLVQFDEDSAVEDGPVTKADTTTVSGLKSEPKALNKAEPAPANKAEGKLQTKTAQ